MLETYYYFKCIGKQKRERARRGKEKKVEQHQK